MRSFCRNLAEEFWEGTSESQRKMVHTNIGTRGLFATTVLMEGADQVLADEPEKHGLWAKTSGVISQTICRRNLLRLSCPLDVRWPKWWVRPRPALL